MLSGLGFVLGRVRELEDEFRDREDGPLVGTVDAARKEGFLCVIWEGSTFRRLEVTADPRDI